jgi:CRP-like cAMP-binding protein
LKSTDINQFLAICKHTTFKNKEVVFKMGSTSQKAGFILSGVVRGYFINELDIEKNIILRIAGTFVSPVEWLSGNFPTKYTFEAILECELLLFNITEFKELAKTNSAIFDLYSWSLIDSINMMLYRLESMVNLSAEQRYKDLLEKHPVFFQKTFNKHIANFLGITPVSLSRIIKRMKEGSNR